VTNDQLARMIFEMRIDYAPVAIPPCPVCGSPRTSVSAVGMGRITYCCSSDDAQPMGKGARFDECMEHFGASRYETSMPKDSRVLVLCDEIEKRMR